MTDERKRLTKGKVSTNEGKKPVDETNSGWVESPVDDLIARFAVSWRQAKGPLGKYRVQR